MSVRIAPWLTGIYVCGIVAMKKWIIVVLVLAAGYLGYRQWQTWRSQAQAAGGPARSTTAPVVVTNINFAVNAAGEITPAEQVSVRPEINGKIERLPVDIGDTVQQGALLFKLDDKELQQQRASSQTAIERAKLELAKAQRDYERALQLRDENLISQELFDNTKTVYELAKNSLDRAQRELAILEERLTKTEVRAPFDCTILTRPISMGQAVSGSGGFNSGTEVLTIADLNSMVINAHVNQADVPRLTVGQQVEVTVEAVTGLKVTGLVERIAPQATIRNNIKGFAARVLLTNVDRRVRPGMTANIKIPVASAHNVRAVPLAAVFTEKNPETDRLERFVYVQRGNTFEKRIVQIGVSDFFYAEVQQGLVGNEIVSLELPKEDRIRIPQNLAALAPVAEAASPGARPQETSIAQTNPPAPTPTPAPPPSAAAAPATAAAAQRPTGGNGGAGTNGNGNAK